MANHSNLTVDTLVDERDGSVTDGDISLRDALAAVAPGGQITFAPSLSNSTISLSLGQLELSQDVTIDGSDAPGLTLSGNNAVRVFDLTGLGIRVDLNDLEIANGRATNGTGEDQAGAGIRGTNETTLNLENVTFTGNVAGFAGAIYTGFSSTNTIINSTFTNNQGTLAGSERGGGAIATRSNGSLTVIGSTFTGNRGINGGAVNSLLGELTLEDSTFLNNDTEQGSGANTLGYGGAVFVDGANASGPGFSPGSQGGTVTIRNSEFRGNTGKGQGGGLFLFLYPADALLIEGSTIVDNELLTGAGGDSLGGGIRLGNGTYTIRQTTIANNRAESQGGGLWVGESSPGTIVNSTFFGNQAIDPNDNTRGLGGGLLFSTTSPQTLTNVTIAQNQAGNQGGGIVGSSNVTLTNTIVANNTANNPFGNKQNASDRQGFNTSPPPYFSDGGGNLQWPEITNNFNDANITATVLQADPRLGTLQADANGVLIVPLQSGSAAIDAGVNNPAPSLDQRGQTRPVDGDKNGSAIADIGAIEFAPQTTPVNNAPTDLSLSNDTIPENASSNSPIGTLSTTDPDPNDTFTYRLVPGAGDTDNAAFTIIGDELRLNPSPNFETQSSYNIRIQTTDANGLSYTEAFTINITDVPEGNNPPTFTPPDKPDQTVTPGETVTIPNFVTNISPGAEDESQQPLSFILETEGDDIFLDPPTLDPDTGTLSYTLSDEGGIATVRVTLTDQSGGQETSEPTTFTITSIGEVEVALTTDDIDLAEALTYDTTPIPPSLQIATTLAQDVTTLGTEAVFDNLVGLYPVVGVDGGIDTDGDGNADLLPGDSGYARAAITNRVENFQILAGGLGNPDFNTTTSEFGDVLLNGGRFYAPFVIAQGGDVGFEGFITNEDAETSEFNNAATFPQDLVAYFAFVGANPDGAKHLKNFGNSIFGFEDLPANLGISDNDFDDAVFQLAFNPIS